MPDEMFSKVTNSKPLGLTLLRAKFETVTTLMRR